MATLTYVQPTITGVAPGYVAASGGGDKVAPNDRGYLFVRNASGGSITVTVATPGVDKYNQARPDIAVAVPAGADRAIGPFPADLGDTTTDGLVAITYTGVTSLTVAAVSL
jgi:hypothetical protein